MAKKKSGASAKQSRFKTLSVAADTYGARSFDNYVQIRSLAERMQARLCAYMQHDQKCVFLVPPQGLYGAENYGSGAYSVSGKGFLPLEPISFGLGIRISETGDFMRLVLNCRKEGNKIKLQIEDKHNYDFILPISDSDVDTCLEGLFQYLLHWFNDRVEHYDHGTYGTTDIGFDILRVDDES
ncbi:MAG: hypothetical protein V3U57_01005 [Robiginitomaculum sp.]